MIIVSIGLSIWYEQLDDMNLLARNYLMGTLRIFPTTFFVLVGYGFKDRILKCTAWAIKRRIIVIFVLLLIQAAVCLTWNERIDVQLFSLANPWIYFVKSLNGTYIILLIAQLIHSKLLTFLGTKTKELMILHYPPFYYTVVLRILLGKIFSPNIAGAIIITVITISCCLFIDKIMSILRIYNMAMGR